MKKKRKSSKKKNNILILIVPMVLLAVVLSYIIITKTFFYEEYTSKFMSINCYTEKSVKDNIKYEVVNKTKKGERIVCEIPYELSFTVSKMSYDLNYTDSLILESVGEENNNLILNENHFLYNYSGDIYQDKSPMMTFVVKEDLTDSKINISITNIKFYTKTGKYYQGKDLIYPIELDNNKKKIYLYQNDSGDYYYLSEKRDDYWNMIDIYECQNDKCTAKLLENEKNSYVISDDKLIYNEFTSQKKKKEVLEDRVYHVVLPNSEEHIIKYYHVAGKDLYTFENVNGKKQGMDVSNLNGFIANYDEIDNKDYNLSFTNETLNDGYLLVDNVKDSRKSYVYDFINKKIVYNVKIELSYYNYFNKTKDGYSILIENPDDLEMIYLTNEFKDKYNHLIVMDDSYRKFENGNILFKDNNKYYLYQEDGTFVKNVFEKIKPTYIYVKDNSCLAVVWNNKDNYFTLYDEDSNEIKKSNEYEKIYFVNRQIYVLKDNIFTIIDYNENIVHNVVTMTEELENIENYDGIISFRNRSIPEGEKGAYIVYYYNEKDNNLIKEELDYEIGWGN